MNPTSDFMEHEKELAGIEYVGLAGTTRPCVQALQMMLMQRNGIARATLLTAETTHAFLVELEGYRYVAIKSGFASGYGGEGPRGLSKALVLLFTHGVEIRHVRVSGHILSRLDSSCLTESEVEHINQGGDGGGPWAQFVHNNDWEHGKNGTIWGDAPHVIPFGIVDPRLIDLGIAFWKDPDAALMKGFRRLEGIIRERTGLEGEGERLLKPAFLSEDAPLHWPGVEGGEKEARANLIRGVFGAFRNPRMHREMDAYESDMLAEFLLLNKLYRLEGEAVAKERVEPAAEQTPPPDRPPGGR